MCHIAGKFGKFGESSVICQTKTTQISTCNYDLLAESIHLPNFFCQMLKTSKFAKFYPHQTFPLYGIAFLFLRFNFPCFIQKVNFVGTYILHVYMHVACIYACMDVCMSIIMYVFFINCVTYTHINHRDNFSCQA